MTSLQLNLDAMRVVEFKLEPAYQRWIRQLVIKNQAVHRLHATMSLFAVRLALSNDPL